MENDDKEEEAYGKGYNDYKKDGGLAKNPLSELFGPSSYQPSSNHREAYKAGLDMAGQEKHSESSGVCFLTTAPKECLTSQLLQFEADHIWVQENMEVLLRQFAEQWIGVKNGRVIACARDLTNLLSLLPDPSNTCVEFITREPIEMLL